MSEFCFFLKIFDCRLRNLLAVLFSLSRDVSESSGPPLIFINNAARFLRIEREKERESGTVLFCGELLWITSVTGIERLIGGFGFGWYI